MNTDPTSVFARKLFQSPDMLNGDLDTELVAQIRRFAKGELSDDDAAIIKQLIEDDSCVAACYRESLLFVKATNVSHLADKRITERISAFLQRIKRAIIPGESSDALAGLALAQSDHVEEFMPHLEGQVVTRLWKNEAGKTILWLITENPDCILLHYRFVGGSSGEALLKDKGGSFMEEIELDADFVASAHPEITRISH